jgi:protein-S-isoprenylcysteine O-methyltransferase Ste14
MFVSKRSLEMKTNVGTLDRILRAALGVALLWLAFASGFAVMDASAPKWIAAAAGLVMLGVAAVGRCPVYTLMGVKTCKA